MATVVVLVMMVIQSTVAWFPRMTCGLRIWHSIYWISARQN
jgi:hypothetical protein